jgi:hypothetical protein
MTTPYRGLELAAERGFETALALGADGGELGLGRRVYEERVGRAAFGAVGVGIALVMFVDAVRLLVVPWSFVVTTGATQLAYLLVAAWPLATVAYVAGRLGARARLGRLLVPVEPTGDAAADLARLQTSRPSVVLSRLAWAAEKRSVALPMMALSLLAPLTIHAIVCALVKSQDSEAWFFEEHGFGTWIAMSVAIVGHAHVALAVCCWRFAGRVRSMHTAELARDSNADWTRAMGVAFVCALVPGVVLLAIPPVLSLVTGILFVPLMFLRMRRRVLLERRLLGLLEA